MNWQPIAYTLSAIIIGFTAIGLALLPTIHRWLVKHRWAVGEWE